MYNHCDRKWSTYCKTESLPILLIIFQPTFVYLPTANVKFAENLSITTRYQLTSQKRTTQYIFLNHLRYVCNIYKIIVPI